MKQKPLSQMTHDERHETRIERRLNTCIHHNGTINKTCDAGVEYSSIGKTVDLGYRGRPFVTPCHLVYDWGGQLLECESVCDKRRS